MPHDANNEVLAVGDLVSLDCRVTDVQAGEDYCNVTLEAILPPNPPEMPPCALTTNSRQVIKCRRPAPEPTLPAGNATAGAASSPEDVIHRAAKPEPKKAASINRR